MKNILKELRICLKNHHSLFSGLAVRVDQLEMTIFLPVKKFANCKDTSGEHFFTDCSENCM